jgi:hypothetical protein
VVVELGELERVITANAATIMITTIATPMTRVLETAVLLCLKYNRPETRGLNYKNLYRSTFLR